MLPARDRHVHQRRQFLQDLLSSQHDLERKPLVDLLLLPERLDHLLDEGSRESVPLLVAAVHPRAVVGRLHRHRGQVDALGDGDGVGVRDRDRGLEPQPRDLLLRLLELGLQVGVPRRDFGRGPEIPQRVAHAPEACRGVGAPVVRFDVLRVELDRPARVGQGGAVILQLQVRCGSVGEEDCRGRVERESSAVARDGLDVVFLWWLVGGGERAGRESGEKGGGAGVRIGPGQKCS